MLFAVGRVPGQYFKKETKRRQGDPEPGIFFLKLNGINPAIFLLTTTKSLPTHTLPPDDSTLIEHMAIWQELPRWEQEQVVREFVDIQWDSLVLKHPELKTILNQVVMEKLNQQ